MFLIRNRSYVGHLFVLWPSPKRASNLISAFLCHGYGVQSDIQVSAEGHLDLRWGRLHRLHLSPQFGHKTDNFSKHDSFRLYLTDYQHLCCSRGCLHQLEEVSWSVQFPPSSKCYIALINLALVASIDVLSVSCFRCLHREIQLLL